MKHSDLKAVLGMSQLFEASLLTCDLAYCYVLEDEHKNVVGYATTLLTNGGAHLEITSLVVHPARRHHGHGTALVDRAIDLGADTGCMYVTLKIAQNDYQMIKLLTKMTFAFWWDKVSTHILFYYKL
jgi:ribosomal protein S18 acetylase RimI-like enzyme